jgi:flagellar biosynthesis regulator FlaF
LFGAIAGTAAVALMIGCGGTEFQPAPNTNIQLAPNVRVLPQDGSAVVTMVGQDGLRIASRPLDNVQPGDILAVCAPISDSARAFIGHRGGYMELQNKMKLVPVEMLPPRYRARSAGYSHYVVFNGRVSKKTPVDTSGRMADGSQAFASSTGSGSRGFISGITHAISHALTSVTSDVTHVATNVASDVTNVATNVTSDVTNVATNVASDVTNVATNVTSDVTNVATNVASDLTSAETSVAHAVTSAIGPIDQWVLTEIEAVGQDFSKIYKEAIIPFERVVLQGISDVESLANEMIGNWDVDINSDSTATINIKNATLQAPNGATLTLNGSVTVGGDLHAQMNISNYQMQAFSASLGLRGGTNMTVTGNGIFTKQLVKVTLDPIVIPAGDVPVVIVPIIAVSAEAEIGSSLVGVNFQTSLGGTIGVSSTDGSAVTRTAQGSASGSAHWTGSTTNLINWTLVPVAATLTFNIDDVAGPFFEVDLPALNLTSGAVTSELEGEVDFRGGFNLDPLGYKGWSVSTQLGSIKLFDVPLPNPPLTQN